MTVDLRVTGADDLAALSRRLKEYGDKQLRRELYRAIASATKDARTAARANAAAILPHRGGLAAQVASSTLRTSTSPRGVKVTARSKSTNIYGLDRGVLKHPVFGHRDRWVSQSVPPGWFSKPMEAAAPAIRRSLVHAMDDIARKIEGHQ